MKSYQSHKVIDTTPASKVDLSWMVEQASELAQKEYFRVNGVINVTTRNAIEELETGRGKRFKSVDDLFNDLN